MRRLPIGRTLAGVLVMAFLLSTPAYAQESGGLNTAPGTMNLTLDYSTMYWGFPMAKFGALAAITYNWKPRIQLGADVSIDRFTTGGFGFNVIHVMGAVQSERKLGKWMTGYARLLLGYSRAGSNSLRGGAGLGIRIPLNDRMSFNYQFDYTAKLSGFQGGPQWRYAAGIMIPVGKRP